MAWNAADKSLKKLLFGVLMTDEHDHHRLAFKVFLHRHEAMEHAQELRRTKYCKRARAVKLIATIEGK